MGYATVSAGYRGIVQQRDYNTLLAVEVVPTQMVDGKPTAWKRSVWVGEVTETVREVVGLSEADAFSTTNKVEADSNGNGGIPFTRAVTYSSGTGAFETYSRTIERTKDGDSNLWTVRLIERSCTPTEQK